MLRFSKGTASSASFQVLLCYFIWWWWSVQEAEVSSLYWQEWVLTALYQVFSISTSIQSRFKPGPPPGGHCVVMYMYLLYSRLINAGFSNKQSHSVPAHSLRVTTTVRNARHLASIPTRSPSYATCTSSKDLHTSGLPSRRRRPWAGSSHGPRTLQSRYSHHLQPAAYCTASQIAAFTPTPTSTLARYSSAPLSSRTTISPANRPWSFKA